MGGKLTLAPTHPSDFWEELKTEGLIGQTTPVPQQQPGARL